MNREKMVFRALKWLFTFFIVGIGISIVGIVIMFIALQFINIDSIGLTATEMGFVDSPIFLGLLVINLVLIGLLFYYVRTFFKNLELDQIFVVSNVKMAKKISLLLLILTFTNGLPDLFKEAYTLDLTYSLAAAIIWALSKILEKANIIAEENELTI